MYDRYMSNVCYSPLGRLVDLSSTHLGGHAHSKRLYCMRWRDTVISGHLPPWCPTEHRQDSLRQLTPLRRDPTIVKMLPVDISLGVYVMRWSDHTLQQLDRSAQLLTRR